MTNIQALAKSYIWFDFRGHSPSGKTSIYVVKTMEETPAPLGTIQWYGPWRCYAFYPSPGTIFEKKCLRDIAEKCEQLTIQQGRK